MKLDRILVFLMVLSIFLDDFIVGYSNNDARAASAFDFYYYYLIFLSFLTYFLFNQKKFPSLPGWFLKTILVLFTASFIAGSVAEKISFSMLKQMIGIVFSSVAYYNVIRFTKFDVRRLFDIYLKISFWVAAIGVVEEALRVAGFNHLFDNTKRVSVGIYRVYSIMGEPYFLAVALIPAVYFYLGKMIGNKAFRDRRLLLRFGVIFACYIFTFSSAGFIGLAIMFVMLAYSLGYFNPASGRFILLAVVTAIAAPIINPKEFSLSEITVRIEDSFKAFSSTKALDKKAIAELNSSTFALYSNYLIAQKSFFANPLLGSGLGTHEATYNEYFETLFGKKFLKMYGMFNSKDGNSLFIRMMSETGVLGLILIIIFMFRFFVSRKNLEGEDAIYHLTINHGIFIVIVVRLLRTGNYISQGFFFFFFLYYITYIYLRKTSKYKRLSGT